MWFGDKPELTELFASFGFVVERGADARLVHIHMTPSVSDVRLPVSWHYPGPTAPWSSVRIVWDEDRLASVIEAAEHPVEHDTPPLPETVRTVVDGDGWEAVAPTEQVVENAVLRRSAAERYDYQIL